VLRSAPLFLAALDTGLMVLRRRLFSPLVERH